MNWLEHLSRVAVQNWVFCLYTKWQKLLKLMLVSCSHIRYNAMLGLLAEIRNWSKLLSHKASNLHHGFSFLFYYSTFWYFTLFLTAIFSRNVSPFFSFFLFFFLFYWCKTVNLICLSACKPLTVFTIRILWIIGYNVLM